MPASFVIDRARRMVRSRGWGVLVDEDLAATQRGLRDSPDFEPDFSQLYDFRDVTDLQLTGPAVRELARSSPFSPRARRAVVVPGDEAYGMARMYQLVSDRDAENFQVFRDADEALRWLDSVTSPAGGAS